MLLHGGFCTLEPLRPLAEVLAAHFTVYAYERPGHGRTPDVEGAYSYEGGAAELLAFLDARGLDSAHVVGFSDGAVIALMLAIGHPERVRSLVAISANFAPSGFTGTFDEVAPADLVTAFEPTRQLYGALSPDGPGHADVVLAKLAELWATGPQIAPETLGSVSAPSLIVSGEFDTIHPEHSRLIAGSIAHSRLYIVPGATHDLVEQHRDQVIALVSDFVLPLRDIQH
ncbi:alpha/beta fold hydrolase [Subtercola sp. YIM 133946]|uniref:alpha/beta fold hydrolase n=1 Tax=Subtercola sp. YIM 133946 TaxID=3118909 RepID=UPI002F92B449